MIPRVPSRVPEGLLYALAVFGPLAFGCVEPWSVAALQILSFLLALSCFLRGPRPVPAQASWAWLVPAGFAAFGLLQLLAPVAADLPRPGVPFTAAPRATQAAVLLWASYAAVLWSVPQVISTHETARRYARVVFGLGVLLAAQGLLQYATGSNRLYWIRATGLPAVFGPYYNRDHAANLLLMTAGMGAGVFLSMRRRWPAVDGLPSYYVRSQGRLAAGVVLILAGVAACASRGAALAVVLGGAVVAFFGAAFAKRGHDRRSRAAAALAFGAFVVFAAFKIVGAGADAGARTDHPIAERFFLYADGFRWLRDAPIFGTGLGSFETVYPAYQDLDLTALATHAHSDWLELALETGLFGLLAALAAASAGVFGAARTWREAASSEMRGLIAGAFAAAIAFALHSLFEFGFQIPGNAALFFGIAGFLLSAPLWKDKAAPRTQPEPPSAPAALAGAGVFLLLAFAAVRPGSVADLDPVLLRRYAAGLYSEAAAEKEPDAAALREALRPAIAVVELRPFDYKALALSGVILARLGRAADAREFAALAGRVGFTPVVVGEGDAWARRAGKTRAALEAPEKKRRAEKP